MNDIPEEQRDQQLHESGRRGDRQKQGSGQNDEEFEAHEAVKALLLHPEHPVDREVVLLPLNQDREDIVDRNGGDGAEKRFQADHKILVEEPFVHGRSEGAYAQAVVFPFVDRGDLKYDPVRVRLFMAFDVDRAVLEPYFGDIQRGVQSHIAFRRGVNGDIRSVGDGFDDVEDFPVRRRIRERTEKGQRKHAQKQDKKREKINRPVPRQAVFEQ